MNPEEKEGVRILLDHFGEGKPVTQNALDEFCNRHKIERCSVENIMEYRYQDKHDKNISELFPKILAELAKIKYPSEYGMKKDLKGVIDHNDAIRVNIVKLFEEHAISYNMMNAVTKELSGIVEHIIESAGNTVYAKANQVLERIAFDKFGERFNMKHSRDFAQQLYEEEAKKQGKDPEKLD